MEGKVLNLLSLGSTWSFTRKKLLKERLIGYSFISQMTIEPNWEIFYTVNKLPYHGFSICSSSQKSSFFLFTP